MKKILLIDGNSREEEDVRKKLGSDYDVSSASFFDVTSKVLSTVVTIANTIDSLDEYAGGHSLRVAVTARDIARNLGWDERDAQNVYFISLLHDMGMIAVPSQILNKPERLTDEEFGVVKLHAETGAKMLRDIDILEHLSDGVLYHHERWDGKGYPKGLSGEEIPACARIISIADAYDAMSSDRVYRKRLTTDKIISEFSRCKGGQFDPDMADVFIFMLKEGYTTDPDIGQTKEASDRAVADGGFADLFDPGSARAASSDDEMDVLTGLFSRSYLNTRVGNKIAAERSGALMLIDITRFASLNEKFGSDEGDEVLRKFSLALKSLFREADVVSHVSSDEFAVYVSGESGKSVIEKKAEMITGMIEERDEFMKYRGIIGIAIGISMCQEDGITFEELYNAANLALDEAKRSGENTHRFR